MLAEKVGRSILLQEMCLPFQLGSLNQICNPCTVTTQPALLQNSFVQTIFKTQLPIAVTLLLLCIIPCMAFLVNFLGMFQHFLREEVASWCGGMQNYPQQLSLFSEDQHEVQRVQGAGSAVVTSEQNFFAQELKCATP